MEMSVDVCKHAIGDAGNVLKKVLGNTIDFKMPEIKTIKFSRAVSFWASVHLRNDGGFDLKYSKPLFTAIPDNKNPYKSLVETTIHELIHTIKGCDNHGHKFQVIAQLVSANTQYNVGTKSSSKERGVDLEHHPRVVNAKYVTVCPDCGQKYYHMRKPKYFDNYSKVYSCGVCGGRHLYICKKEDLITK